MVRRAGLSRIDLLVGVGILFLIGGLLLASIQRVREAAAAVECKNKLKQFALATNNYVQMGSGRLPPLVDLGEGAETGRGLPSLFATLMPFYESTYLIFRPHRSADHYLGHSSVPFTAEKNGDHFAWSGGIANQRLRMFCEPGERPDDQLQDVPMTLPDGTTGYYATGSYAANGLALWGSSDIARAFPRGAGNTILFSERPRVCSDATGAKVYNLWGLGYYSPNMPTFAALTPTDPPGLPSTGQIAPALPLPDAAAPDRDALLRVRIGRRDAAPVSPDIATPVQRVHSGQPCDPRLPGTPHRGGMQAAMADASVRVFALDTSPWVFWSACPPD